VAITGSSIGGIVPARQKMPFLQSSIEGSSAQLQDPWDWTVDQVIFTLTNNDSSLLRDNGTLSLPDEKQFADALRDNDVTGLALLTEVQAQSLRDDLKIKSMGHRASINLLVRKLQDVSTKYQAHLVQSGRVSSADMGSRMATPFLGSPQRYDPRMPPRVSGSWHSPLASSDQFQHPPWIDSVTAGAQEQLAVLRRESLATAPEIPQPDWQHPNSMGNGDGLGISAIEPGNGDKELGRVDVCDGKSNVDIEGVSPNEDSGMDFCPTPPEQHVRQGEVMVTDETGRKRRRLMLASPDAPNLGEADETKAHTLNSSCHSSATLQKEVDDADPVTNKLLRALLPELGHSAEDVDRILAGTEEVSTHGDEILLSSRQPSVAPEPGAVVVDEHGRKRMRPILVSQPDDLEISCRDPAMADNGRPSLHTSASPLNTVEAPSAFKQRLYGRKASRRKDQIYLGPEPLCADELFYGNVPLESKLDDVTESKGLDDTDEFAIVPNQRSSHGLSLYVNARMKYYLQSQTINLRAGDNHCSGIVPYPDRIGKKHFPLSITIFSSSVDGGITAVRSNRSKWIRDIPPHTQKNSGHQTHAFNVADPILAQDENDDPEWAALEKWKYMKEEDDVLPVYGESGSEGEYELDTWKEMEQERGGLERPTGVSRSQKLNAEEVEELIVIAVDNIVEEWNLKRKPKLLPKAWRLWMKSRRDKSSKTQTDHLDHAIELLDKRLTNLRKEIAEEAWSKPSQVSGQCKIMQPSIFDREDNKWKLAVLTSRRIPLKPEPAMTKSKGPKRAIIEQALNDGEEDLETDGDDSGSSEGSLGDFIISDDSEVEEHQPIIEDEDFSMADAENVLESGMTEAEPGDTDLIGEIIEPKSEPIERQQGKPDGKGLAGTLFKAPFVDLTMDSDPLEPSNPELESKPTSGIKTPPINGSDDESDVFQRSRKRKAVFKRIPIPQNSNIINLESSSPEPTMTSSPTVVKKILPALSDVVAIRSMDPSELVERQDRKRLLIWIVSHAPATRRQAASKYLTNISLEKARYENTKALKRIRGFKRRISGVDNEISDSILSIASWHVCWTIPVKADQSGIKTSHINTTLADEDGFEPFYDFLLECLSHCDVALNPPQGVTPKKKREKILREPEESLDPSPFRKRKYIVEESQATLNQRQAALDRKRGDDERRREEQRRRTELTFRLKAMGSNAEVSPEVVVNPGRLGDQDAIHLNTAFGNGARMKEHQKEGLQFLWREITAEHEDLQGCLLAQTMGLGKTMQIIALLVTLAEASRSSNGNARRQVPPALRESRTLILCPPALLENWWDEFLIWVPQPFSDTIGELRKVSSAMKPPDRLNEIYAWSEKGGVLLLGYDTFKNLIHDQPRGGKDTKRTPLEEGQHEEITEALLRRANLVVADEAHTFKGRKTKINSAMNQIQTRSRVALTGSPLNNNLEEYYTLIDWIAPNYLGSHTEFKATYEEPIREGLYQDSTLSQYYQSRTKLKAFEMEMEPKVHRADLSVLHADLHGKMEFIVEVPLTQLQEDLYRVYVESMRATVSDSGPHLASLWSWLGILQLLCNHPKCFIDQILALKAELDEPSRSKALVRLEQTDRSTPEEKLVGSDEDDALVIAPSASTALRLTINKCEELLRQRNEAIDQSALSCKMLLLMRILELSTAARDKVLVFSHRIATLNYIQEQLQRNRKAFIRIDGKLQPQKRQQITKDFNEGDVNVCLISTRAGGTGLNLFGANRIVILDEHFNPSWEQQAIGRAYRIGQQKPVYVYRLTAGGTFEQTIQNQGLFKQQLATRVVDKKNPSRNAVRHAGQYLFPPKPVSQGDLSQCAGQDPLVLDHLLAERTRYDLSHPYCLLCANINCAENGLCR